MAVLRDYAPDYRPGIFLLVLRLEAIKICAKTNASLGLSYDPWSSFWTSDPTVRGKQQACCEQHTSLSLDKLV